MIWMLWTACAVDGAPDGAGPSAPSATTDTPAPTESPPTDEPGGEEPPVEEVMAEFCPNPRPGELLPRGDELARVTLSGAGRCNDGTPPVLYVRAATDPAHADDWVWRFDGGSYCSDAASCAARWCGTHFPYGQRHMSSADYPEAIAAVGISVDADENTFRGWNHVFAAYCSSDSWVGTRSDVSLAGEPAFSVHFEGALVARDGIDAAVAGLVSDDGSVRLPAITRARTLVVAGTSAGCQGATRHSAAFAAAAPKAAVATVLDSCFDAAPEVLAGGEQRAMEADLERFWEQTAQGVWGGELDAACAADHPSDAWRCSGLDLQVRDYLPSVFIHHDLADPVVFGAYADLGLSRYAYADAAIDTFRMYEDAYPHVSTHAYTCAEHTGIDDTVSFLFRTVVDAEAGGLPLSFHDALAASLAGRRVVAVDSLPSSGSVCMQ